MSEGEIKFYHSKRSTVFLSIFWGIFFLIIMIGTVVFLVDLMDHMTSTKKIASLLLLSFLPLSLTGLIGLVLFRTVQNDNAICTIYDDRIIYREFNGRGIINKALMLNQISKATLKQRFFGDGYIKLSTIKGNNYPISYINYFLSSSDKKRVAEEINRRLALFTLRD